jgi:hypothetical protein
VRSSRSGYGPHNLDAPRKSWQNNAVVTAQAKTIHAAGVAERERVLAALREQAPQLRGLGIMRLSLFGSIAASSGPMSTS